MKRFKSSAAPAGGESNWERGSPPGAWQRLWRRRDNSRAGNSGAIKKALKAGSSFTTLPGGFPVPAGSPSGGPEAVFWYAACALFLCTQGSFQWNGGKNLQFLTIMRRSDQLVRTCSYFNPPHPGLRLNSALSGAAKSGSVFLPMDRLHAALRAYFAPKGINV